MTFTESIKTGLARLTDFSGRASRSEYGWFGLFLLLVLAGLVLAIVLASRLTGAPVSLGALALLLIPLFLAGVAVQARRLRDAGLSPWWTLANLIPYVGVPLVLALSLRPGRSPEGSETAPGSLSSLSLMMVSGWGTLTGGSALAGEEPQGRSWLAPIGMVLLAVVVAVAGFIVYQDRRGKPPQPAPVPAAPAPRSEPRLNLIDEVPGTRLYLDPATARLVGPDLISIQLVFDYAQAGERDGVRYLSLKQNEVVNCAARSSAWSTRFYMSEPLGEGAAVLIAEGSGSAPETGGHYIGPERIDAMCGLLPGLNQAPPPSPAPDAR